MAAPSAAPLVLGGVRIGAACGAGVGVVLAIWAGDAMGIDVPSAAFMVILGALAGGAIGLGASVLAAAAFAVLSGRVRDDVRRAIATAAAALGAAGMWLLGMTVSADWLHDRWMVAVVALSAAVLAAVALPRSERGMSAARRRIEPWVVIGAVVSAGLGTAGAAIAGVGPLTVWIGQVSLPPVFAIDAGAAVMTVGFEWGEDGYCPGQFAVEAVETTTSVRVLDVQTHDDHNLWGGICAGVGTADGIAWVDVELAAPLGDRTVVRDRDGVPLTAPPR